MELPPGLASLQRKQKEDAKAAKKQPKKHETRDASPKRESSKTKYREREVAKFDRKAKFRVYSQRLGAYITDASEVKKKRKLSFELPNKFFPRFEGMDSKKVVGSDILVVYQFSEGVDDRAKVFTINLNMINAVEDLDWEVDSESSSEGSDSDDYKPPASFKAFLARTTENTVTCDYSPADGEDWHLLLDVNRKKRKFVLKQITLKVSNK